MCLYVDNIVIWIMWGQRENQKKKSIQLWKLFQIFQNLGAPLKNFGAKEVTRSEWYTEGPQVLCVKVASATRRPWLVQNWCRYYYKHYNLLTFRVFFIQQNIVVDVL